MEWEVPEVDLLLQLVANGLVQGTLVACLAAGFGIVYRSFRVFHVATGAQFVIASYAFYAAAVALKLPVPAAAAVAIVISAAYALLLEFAVYRPFARRKCPGGATMIASLGVLIVTENIIALAFGNEVKTIPHVPYSIMEIGSIRLTTLQAFQFVICAALFAIAGIFIANTRIGKACWAMGDSAELLRTMGLPYGSVRVTAILVGALLVTVPALAVSADTGMDPHEGMRWLLVSSMAAFFGGRDNYWGWGIGAMALGLVQTAVVWRLPSQWADTAAFALLLGVLAFRPHGLFGGARRAEEAA